MAVEEKRLMWREPAANPRGHQESAPGKEPYMALVWGTRSCQGTWFPAYPGQPTERLVGG